MSNTAHHSRTMNEEDAAKYCGVSRALLAAARLKQARCDGPAFVKLGRAVRYLREDLDAWLAASRVNRRTVSGLTAASPEPR